MAKASWQPCTLRNTSTAMPPSAGGTCLRGHVQQCFISPRCPTVTLGDAFGCVRRRTNPIRYPRIIFAGDSVMLQVFYSIACAVGATCVPFPELIRGLVGKGPRFAGSANESLIEQGDVVLYLLHVGHGEIGLLLSRVRCCARSLCRLQTSFVVHVPRASHSHNIETHATVAAQCMRRSRGTHGGSMQRCRMCTHARHTHTHTHAHTHMHTSNSDVLARVPSLMSGCARGCRVAYRRRRTRSSSAPSTR